MNFLGVVVSSVTIMPLFDIFGRKWFVLISMCFNALILQGLFLFREYWMVLVIYFLFGFTIVASATAVYTYLAEIVPPQQRKYFVIGLEMVNRLFQYTVPFCYFVFKTWAAGLILYILTIGVLSVGIFFMPESPKFLYDSRRFDTLRKVFSSMARMKKLPKFEGKFDKEGRAEKREEKPTVKNFFRSPLMRRNILVMIVNWSAISFSYYLILNYIKYFNNSIYINSICFATASLLGTMAYGVVQT